MFIIFVLGFLLLLLLFDLIWFWIDILWIVMLCVCIYVDFGEIHVFLIGFSLTKFMMTLDQRVMCVWMMNSLDFTFITVVVVICRACMRMFACDDGRERVRENENKLVHALFWYFADTVFPYIHTRAHEWWKIKMNRWWMEQQWNLTFYLFVFNLNHPPNQP